MKKIEINTTCKRMLADVFTPVGIYLRLRDKYRDTILLESTDHHSTENSYSFICINAIGGIEISAADSIEFKLPGQQPRKLVLKNKKEVPQLLWDFMQRFDAKKTAIKEEGCFGIVFINMSLPSIISRMNYLSVRIKWQEWRVMWQR